MTPNWPIPVGVAGSRRTATRVTPGATSLSNSSHLPLRPYSNMRKPGGVAARPRQAVDEAGTDRIDDDREHDRHRAGRLQHRSHGRSARGQNDVRRERGQFHRVSANIRGIGRGPVGVDAHVVADGPTQLRQRLQERPDPGLKFRIVCGCRQQHADAPHPLALLRASDEWPRDCRAAEKCDELAPLQMSP